MLPQEIIRKKRNGEALTPAEIRFFVNGICDGSIAAEQVSALAMAVFFRSMDFTETAEGASACWATLPNILSN